MNGCMRKSQYCHDWLQARLDWNGNPDELKREEDDIDKINHEALYDEELDDYLDEMPDLEESESANTSMYDQLGSTPASTIISTDMEVAKNMLNLSMGPPELPVTQETSGSVGLTDDTLSDDDQFLDMFKVPPKVTPKVLVPWDLLPPRPWLDPCTLMAEAKFKSDHRTLPPPLGLDKSDVSDTQKVILHSIQTPGVEDTQVNVANPQNRDPLDLDRDANRDKTLQVMQEKHRRESRSSSAGSRSSSGKQHWSGSRSRDETGPKRGQQMPTEDWNSLGPITRIPRPTLDWSQGILEP